MSDRVEAAGGARWPKRLPGLALSEWVAVIWYSADDRGGRTLERLLPRGTVELVIELGPGDTSIVGPDRRIDVDPVSVVGASPGSVVLDRSNRFETIGVTLRPGGAIALQRFQRLWRFRRALEQIDDRHDLGWAAFALERGYYDQAHFSNEFRHHTSLAPEGYLAARTPALNHVRIDNATSTANGGTAPW